MKKTVYHRLFVAYYSWEMALKFGFDTSFDNMQDWEVLQEKAGDLPLDSPLVVM
jgi:hypothetical protein